MKKSVAILVVMLALAFNGMQAFAQEDNSQKTEMAAAVAAAAKIARNPEMRDLLSDPQKMKSLTNVAQALAKKRQLEQEQQYNEYNQ